MRDLGPIMTMSDLSQVRLHPGFDFSEAVGERSEWKW